MKTNYKVQLLYILMPLLVLILASTLTTSSEAQSSSKNPQVTKKKAAKTKKRSKSFSKKPIRPERVSNGEDFTIKKNQRTTDANFTGATIHGQYAHSPESIISVEKEKKLITVGKPREKLIFQMKKDLEAFK